MAHAIEQLLSSEVLSEEVRSTLSEAWEAKLSEAREEITAELREEFAQRYETDKEHMVEALDAMLSDTIKSELEEFASDKRAAVSAKVEYQRKIAEHAALLDKFVMETLKKEIAELREDRKLQEGNFQQLEDFVMEQLTSELNEFHQDKQELLSEKVRLVKEGKEMIAQAKREFISKASTKLAGIVESTLTSELGMLKEDIQQAKENMFGRKIFETFAAEFMSSHLAEGTQISKLSQELFAVKEQLEETQKLVAGKEALIEAAGKKARRLAEAKQREDQLNALLSPLAKDKRELMSNLLESVATEKLQAAFNKYLPTVLNEDTKSSTKAQQLHEAQKTEITGNKARTQDTESEAEIINLRKLAGIIK
jgi:DNA repair exonuclease SbcCD ATPase subunit